MSVFGDKLLRGGSWCFWEQMVVWLCKIDSDISALSPPTPVLSSYFITMHLTANAEQTAAEQTPL